MPWLRWYASARFMQAIRCELYKAIKRDLPGFPIKNFKKQFVFHFQMNPLYPDFWRFLSSATR